MTAAVADFRPSNVAENKIKKQEGVPDVALEATTDILREIAMRRTEFQTIVGFAAETTDLHAAASQKLQEKNLDLVVANDVSEEGAGFAAETNRVTILDKSGRVSVTSLVSKRTVATEIWDHVARLRGLAVEGS